MSLKRTVLDLLLPEQLKELCNELEVEADRRSNASMIAALAGAKRAKPERLVEAMTVPQLREALAQFEQAADGKREDLVHRLLAAGGRTWPLPTPPIELKRRLRCSATPLRRPVESATRSGTKPERLQDSQSRPWPGAPAPAEPRPRSWRHFGGAAAGAGSGIGKMLAIRQPAAVFTRVWFIRNGVSGAGWPGAPMLKVIGM